MESEILPRHQPAKEFQPRKRTKKAKLEESSDESSQRSSVTGNVPSNPDEIEWMKGVMTNFGAEGSREDDHRQLVMEHMEKQDKILEELKTQSVKQNAYNETLVALLQTLASKI